jgi:hypothetical protein
LFTAPEQEVATVPKRIIDGAAFGPDVVASLHQAFDEAWSDIAHRFPEAERDEARNQLAEAIVLAARVNWMDVARVRDTAIRALARAYPSRFDQGNGEQH